MEMASVADETEGQKVVGWRYPPFLHSNYGRMGPKDYTNLTEIPNSGPFTLLASPA